jgi:hypothetical protein
MHTRLQCIPQTLRAPCEQVPSPDAVGGESASTAEGSVRAEAHANPHATRAVFDVSQRLRRRRQTRSRGKSCSMGREQAATAAVSLDIPTAICTAHKNTHSNIAKRGWQHEDLAHNTPRGK